MFTKALSAYHSRALDFRERFAALWTRKMLLDSLSAVNACHASCANGTSLKA